MLLHCASRASHSILWPRAAKKYPCTATTCHYMPHSVAKSRPASPGRQGVRTLTPTDTPTAHSNRSQRRSGRSANSLHQHTQGRLKREENVLEARTRSTALANWTACSKQKNVLQQKPDLFIIQNLKIV